MKIFILVLLLFFPLSLCHNIGNSYAEPDIELKCKLDIKSKILKGTATLKAQLIYKSYLDVSDLTIEEIKTEKDKKLAFKVLNGRLFLTQRIFLGDKKVIIAFKKHLRPKFNKKAKEFLGGNYIDKDFVLLLDSWHPKLRSPATYRLTLNYDKELIAVSESDLITEAISKDEKTSCFFFDHPRDSISLIVGKFYKYEKQIDDVKLIIYLLKQDKDLADKFFKRIGFCLEFYQKLLSKYPFKSFQIVENKLPSGLALPTITLIGSQIIKQPFIENISLPHEFLHSWFGNSCFVSYEKGNWSEGLTTYLADYILEEKSGKGNEYRHLILSDYKSYVHSDNSFPLIRFQARKDRSSKAIGYGKCSMLFHMLRTQIGDKAFFKALSSFTINFRFKFATWTDLRKEFEQASGQKLKDFFNQWLKRKDIPRLMPKKGIYAKMQDGSYKLNLKIYQAQEKPYRLFCPVLIYSQNTKKTYWVWLKDKEQEVTFILKSPPAIAKIDPNFDLMRDLDQEEYPASLSRLFGSKKRYLVLPEKKDKKIYNSLIAFFKQKGFNIIERKELKHSFLKKGDFLILGKTSGRLKQFSGELKVPKNGFVIKVQKNPVNPSHVVAHALSTSSIETAKVVYKLSHYGKYSFLSFKDGEIIKKEKNNYEKGIDIELEQGLSGISSDNIMDKWQIINALKFPKIIYLGEKHDEMGIHKAQLEIIKGLSRYNKIAVGMEMFQRPYQKIIDKYLKGEIDERDFLKQTEYFKRWGFNYHFYRPIVEYCKKKNIPVIALNLPAEISKKIARLGIKSLTEKELKALPKNLDMSNEIYRQLLRNIYKKHKQDNLKNFNHFFEAQIAWDETMALSISEYLTSNPNRQMVVIVGGGHVEYGYGIPSRVKRRLTNIQQAIVLFNQGEDISPQKADFFLKAPHLEEPFVAKLGVLLSGDNKLTVEKVVPKSSADLGKLKEKDRIIALDGHKVNDIYDLKLELFFKKQGEKANVTVLRKEKNGQEKKITLVTGPFEPVNWSLKNRSFHGKK